jgi:hypothetical protein
MRAGYGIAFKLLMRGQTNFLRMLFKFSQIYNVDRQYQDHLREVRYAMRPPRPYSTSRPEVSELYIHPPKVTRTNANPLGASNGTGGPHDELVADGAANPSTEVARPAGHAGVSRGG